MKKMAKTLAMIAAVSGLLGASMVYAQNQADQPQSQMPPMNSEAMQDMMRGMQGGGMGMMGMMNMMSQMGDMMKTCTQMMQAMTPDRETPGQEDKQPDRG